MSEPGFRAGFVAVVGRPNVGKSTLVNAMVGEKISIVTPRPQTTRHRIIGIRNEPGVQIIFVDTPGLHGHGKSMMNRNMNRVSVHAMTDSDVVLAVLEATGLRAEDESLLRRLHDVRAPVVLAINKTDLVKRKADLLPFISKLAERREFAAIVPVSARRGWQLDDLLCELVRHLPVSEPLYPGEMVTDRNQRFRVAETIREKLMWRLRDEVPYGVAVEVDTFTRDERGYRISAVIWVERASHKAIVVGKGGSMLREAGRAARLELREVLGLPVHLDLWVKVRENWSDSEQALRRLGYETE